MLNILIYYINNIKLTKFKIMMNIILYKSFGKFSFDI